MRLFCKRSFDLCGGRGAEKFPFGTPFLLNIVLLLLFCSQFLESAGIKPKIDRVYDHRFHYLDQDRRYTFSFSSNSTAFLIDFYLSSSDQSNAEKCGPPEAPLVSKVEVVIDGEVISPVEREKWLRYTHPLPTAGTSEIKVLVGRTLMGHYIYRAESGQLKKAAGFNPRTLSSIWLRMLFEDSHEARLYTSVPPKVWTKYPEDQKPEDYFCDLHTHFVGAIDASELVKIAKHHKVHLPVSMLDQLGISFVNSRANNKPFLKWKNNILYVQEPDENRSSQKAENILVDAMKIPINKRQDFAMMEQIYEVRSSIIKQDDSKIKKDVFRDMLLSLGKQYRKMNIKYVEFSFSRVSDPDYLQVLHEVLPEIQKSQGVAIRFLAAMKRSNHIPAVEEANLKILEGLRPHLDDPYIVGVDLMGEEKNATHISGKVLAKARQLQKESKRGLFQIRVHAGENNLFPNNIDEALALGATRIGHGLFGVTEKTIALAKHNRAIVEMNVDSNFALSNIDSIREFYVTLKKYVDNDVCLTFGTDGHGVYSSSIHTEIAAAEEIVRYFSDDAEAFMIKLKELLNKTNSQYANEQMALFKEPKFKENLEDEEVEKLVDHTAS